MRGWRKHFLLLMAAVVLAGIVPAQVHAETTLEKLQKAKEEKEKTKQEKGMQRILRRLCRLRRIRCLENSVL